MPINLKTSAPRPKQFVKDENGSHWYEVRPDGEIVPQYDATLREARKGSYFPSVTTIEKDIRNNAFLNRWIKNEVVKAFVATPRRADENEETYAARCLSLADEISRKARERGHVVHKLAEDWPNATVPLGYEVYNEHINNFLSGEWGNTVGMEVMLADREIGIAGRLDRIVMHPVLGRTILDFKTQNVRKKPEFYESFPRQLSFYAQADRKKNGLLTTPRILSAIINTNEPGPIITKLYTQEEQESAYREFLAQVYLWNRDRNFWPGTLGRWAPGFPVSTN